MPRREAVACPQCGADHRVPADGSRDYTCRYCDAQFRVVKGQPRAVPPPGPPASRRAMVLTLCGLLVAAALGLWLARGQLRRYVEGVTRPSAVFEPHRHWRGGKVLWVVGRAHNTSDVVIASPKIAVVFIGPDGVEQFSVIAFKRGVDIAPRQSYPLKLYVEDPPDFAKLDFAVTTRHRKWFELAEGLSVADQKQQRVGAHSWTISGKVVNRGARAARLVRVLVEVIGADGKLLDVLETATEVKRIGPDRAARFTLEKVALRGIAPRRWIYRAIGAAVKKED